MLRKGMLLLLICLSLSAGMVRADRHANAWRFREAVPAKVLSALLENKTAPVKAYLDGGGNPNALLDGDPLLVLAANNGGEETMKLLLDRGAKVNLASARGETALLRVCGHLYRTGTEAIQLLLRHGADVNKTFPKGTTALMLACSLHSRHEEEAATATAAAKLLLKTGAKVNARNQMGMTALRAAQESRCPELVVLLKRAGAKR